MTTQITPVPEANYTAPNRLTQEQAEFSANSDAALLYESTLGANLNVMSGQMNTLAGELTALGNNVEASAGEAEQSAFTSSSNAKFDGKWSTKTGAKTVPYSVNDDTGDGLNYQLLEDIADITASQPSLNPAQWKVITFANTPKPDVSIPFNDGISIERGYPSGGDVTFTRASATGNINKSGVSVDLLVDEPAITSDGLSVYESVTNELLWSEDFSNAVWNKVNTTAVLSSTLSPDGVSFMYTVSATAGNGVIQGVAGGQTIGDTFNGSIFIARRSGTGEIRLQVGTTDLYPVQISPEITRIDVSGVALTDANARLSVSFQTSGDSVYIWGAQLTKTPFVAPYIKTTTAPATRAPDIVSIPMMNNMPAPGKPFTIVCDVNIDDAIPVKMLFASVASPTKNLRSFIQNDTIWLQFGGSTVAMVTSVNKGYVKLAVTFDGNVAKGYENGILHNSVTIVNPNYDPSEHMFIGQSEVSAQHLNSEIKNFEIYHRALNASEIAQLGSAKQ